jgi:N-acetylmuramoyl-L-alanine amidase
VIHYTDLFTCEESIAILCDRERQVSAHFLIDVDGSIYELVNTQKRAWHAGVSMFDDRYNVNDFSIGIELQNGGHTFYEKYGYWPPYPEDQMTSLTFLVHELQHTFLIPDNRIVGHNIIAPDRKIDPGPHFNWDNFFDKLHFLKGSSHETINRTMNKY